MSALQLPWPNTRAEIQEILNGISEKLNILDYKLGLISRSQEEFDAIREPLRQAYSDLNTILNDLSLTSDYAASEFIALRLGKPTIELKTSVDSMYGQGIESMLEKTYAFPIWAAIGVAAIFVVTAAYLLVKRK